MGGGALGRGDKGWNLLLSVGQPRDVTRQIWKWLC